MFLRHPRAAVALSSLALAAAVGAPPGVSQAATVGSPAPAAGTEQIGIKLLQVPTSEASDPRAQRSIVDRLAPGAVIHRKLEVVNLGSAPAHLTVYPAAASISRGIFQIASGRTQNEMTTWVSVSRGALTLAPRSYATLVATVTVPRDAQQGEQYGVIWVQEAAGGTGNVTLVDRVGIRLYLSIGPGGGPATDFTLGTPVTGRSAAGVPFVRVPVHNTGGRAIDVHGTLDLSGGPAGLQTGPFHAQTVVTIAPGQTYPDTFLLSPKLPDGPWQAAFTMVSGVTTKSETVTLDFNGGPATAAHNSFPIILVAAVTIAVLILAIVVLFIARSRWSRRSRHTRGRGGPSEHHLSHH